VRRSQLGGPRGSRTQEPGRGGDWLDSNAAWTATHHDRLSLKAASGLSAPPRMRRLAQREAPVRDICALGGSPAPRSHESADLAARPAAPPRVGRSGQTLPDEALVRLRGRLACVVLRGRIDRQVSGEVPLTVDFHRAPQLVPRDLRGRRLPRWAPRRSPCTRPRCYPRRATSRN